jgi:hypothetical protein
MPKQVTKENEVRSMGEKKSRRDERQKNHDEKNADKTRGGPEVQKTKRRRKAEQAASKYRKSCALLS